MSVPLANGLQDELSHLKVGRGCWGVIAGSGTGSMVTLDFGEKVKRARPLHNPTLSDEARNYEGEYGLYLQDCDWRLQTRQKVLASSASSNEAGGVMLTGLGQIVGQRVREVTFDPPSFDLAIDFANEIQLLVFCFGKSVEEFDHYSFFSPALVYTASSGGELVRASRIDAGAIASRCSG
jgi:hypothetical protein